MTVLRIRVWIKNVERNLRTTESAVLPSEKTFDNANIKADNVSLVAVEKEPRTCRHSSQQKQGASW